MNKKELLIKHVYKHYPVGNKETFTALSDINLTFKKGELVSIVGESGSGKSTLMNLMGGLDSQFEGDIFVENMNLRGQPDKALDKYRKNKVGFVFQSFNLIPHLSILDNVAIALTLSNVSEKEKIEKASALLKRLGLETQLKRKPNQLSGGQKQRVAIARALINDPDIILADEPTGALDSGTSAQILKILKEIADEGKLVIMVTHSEKVAAISSRVIEISDGKIVRDEKNKSYKKQKTISLATKKAKGEKQNLSIRSAIRLAFHNMWASKTKNLLMSFGVAISICALILMLSFGSGLTDYINNVSSDYTNPLIVTVSKKSDMPMDFSNASFTPDEITQMVEEFNVELERNGSEFRVTDQNLSQGYSAMTGLNQSAKIKYQVEGEEKPREDTVFYLYTTPPYYNESNLLEGELSGENEVMFNAKIYKDLGKDAVGKQVTVWVNLDGHKFERTLTVSAVVDTSVFDSILAMYVDYDFLNSIVLEELKAPLSPSEIYITTTDKNDADILNNYVKFSDKYSGSVEERLAEMFTEMSGTISTALTIIACISLIVSSIMILTVLYMSVSERTKEIGVLKSIGARRKDIRRIFTSESFLVGLLSGLIGIAISLISFGIFVAIFKATLGFAPISLRWYYFAIAVGVSIVISMLSGLYPSAKAARLDPVESLRHD